MKSERVSTDIAIDLTTVLDLFTAHIIDLIDERIDEIFGENPEISWSDYGYDPENLNAHIVDGYLMVSVEIDLHDDSQEEVLAVNV